MSDNSDALKPGKPVRKKHEYDTLKRLHETLNGVFIQLPFKFYLIDPHDHRIVFPINSRPARSPRGDRCYRILFKIDHPCHESGMICPCKILLETGKPARITRVDKPGSGNLEFQAYPIFNRDNVMEYIAVCSIGAITHAEMETKLKENESLMRHLSNELYETNQALAIMAKNIERQSKNAEKRVAMIISSKVLPILVKATSQSQEAVAEDLRFILMILNDLVRNVASGDMLMVEKLSPTEIKILTMVKSGMSSDQISHHLFISVETVKTHRKNIRKKLGIRNSTTSLSAFINSKYSNQDDGLDVHL